MWFSIASAKTMISLTVGVQHCNERPQWFGMFTSRYRHINTHFDVCKLFIFNIGIFCVFYKCANSDEKVKQKIERIFKIWEQRAIYNEEFLSDLNGLLSINPAKKPLMNENDDEQASITITNVKNCMRLEKETDKTFKLLPKAPLYDTEALNILKGRTLLTTHVFLFGKCRSFSGLFFF